MYQCARLTVEELPAKWIAVLRWGPCLCEAMNAATCPSCANAQQIADSGLDWQAEYAKAIEAGEAIWL